MKTKLHRQHGLSLPEVFIVIATVVLLAAFLLPIGTSRPSRVSCVNNLKQIGLAFRLYSNDHEDKFPWMVSAYVNPMNSGSREFMNSTQVFRHFQTMSNELVTPKVLVCPTDSQRKKAADFARFSNMNLSYFVNLDGLETNPQMILSGDRNITGGTFANPNLLLVRSTSPLSWTTSMHISAGTVGLADGSVQQVTTPILNQQIAAMTNAVIRLAIP